MLAFFVKYSGHWLNSFNDTSKNDVMLINILVFFSRILYQADMHPDLAQGQ